MSKGLPPVDFNIFELTETLNGTAEAKWWLPSEGASSWRIEVSTNDDRFIGLEAGTLVRCIPEGEFGWTVVELYNPLDETIEEWKGGE